MILIFGFGILCTERGTCLRLLLEGSNRQAQ